MDECLFAARMNLLLFLTYISVLDLIRGVLLLVLSLTMGCSQIQICLCVTVVLAISYRKRGVSFSFVLFSALFVLIELSAYITLDGKHMTIVML